MKSHQSPDPKGNPTDLSILELPTPLRIFTSVWSRLTQGDSPTIQTPPSDYSKPTKFATKPHNPDTTLGNQEERKKGEGSNLNSTNLAKYVYGKQVGLAQKILLPEMEWQI